MSAKKKPTMKEMEKVVNNVIHDLQIINQKVDAAFFGIKNFIEFSEKSKEFAEWLEKQNKKEQDERDKSDKATIEANNSGSTAKK